jgi:hypothetical protein
MYNRLSIGRGQRVWDALLSQAIKLRKRLAFCLPYIIQGRSGKEEQRNA